MGKWVIRFGVVLLLMLSGGWVYLAISSPPLLTSAPYSQAIVDRDGTLLRLTLAADQQYRLPIMLEEVSPQLIKATLLQEDRYFYYHPGVNPMALVRAAKETFLGRQRRYGGSTITMQLARLIYSLNTTTIGGKLQQIYYALLIERHYSKQEILTAYFNLAPYGGNVSGVAAASLIYFRQTPATLSLSEAIMLSVIPQNPVKRRPHTTGNADLEEAYQRLSQRWYTTTDKTAVMALPLTTQSTQSLPFLAPHFVDNILQQHPPQDQITTTLRLLHQQLLEKNIHDYLKEIQRTEVTNAAALLVDNTNMAVTALVGSGDFFAADIHGQINGTRAKRSPGSTLKPFVFALAIEQGLITPHTILYDIPTRYGEYDPENFNTAFSGPITAQAALNLSRNIPAVTLAQQISQPDLYDFLAQAQIEDLKPREQYGLSIVLGGIELTMQELTQLYAMLANKGVYQPLCWQSPCTVAAESLLSPEASFITAEMLSHNPPLFTTPLPVVWKTGTSSAYRDAWAVGNFGHYTLAVWLGHFSNKSNQALVGRNLAAPLFWRIIQSMQQTERLSPTAGLNPEGLNLTQVAVCTASGKLATPHCPQTTMTWFIPGVSPIAKDDLFREVAINPVTGLQTCKENADSVYKVFEFWPSDVAEQFKQSGIVRNLPPPFEPSCQQAALSNHGTPPRISSPRGQQRYTVTQRHREIPLSATTDSDVRYLYWFVNNGFIGRSAYNEILSWSAESGPATIQVIDDQGRTHRVNINVQYAN